VHNCPYCNIEAESSVKHNGTKASCFPPTDFKEPLRQHNSMVADMSVSDFVPVDKVGDGLPCPPDSFWKRKQFIVRAYPNPDSDQ